MRLYLKNIGMIKEADVKIDGLTVIAGENDTGKSTVGKVIFSIIKAMQKYEDELEESLESKLTIPIERLYFNLRKYLRADKILGSDTYYKFRELFYPSYFLKELIDATNFNEIIRKKEEFLRQELSSEEFKKIKFYLDEIKDILSKPLDVNIVRKKALEKMLISEFYGEILLKGKNEGIISIKEFDVEIFKVLIKKEKEKDKNIIDDFNFLDILSFDNATYIETPLIVNYSNLIENAKTFFDVELFGMGIPTTSFHSKDLINKLVEISFLDNDIFLIEKIINGKFYFDRSMKDFVFRKKNKKYRNFDIATGIKSFGILDILFKNGFINEKSLLIIDEPEVHLHPKWQIEYAKLIIELVKRGIKVLITSHSPFFIDAIDKLSYEINVDYYFAEGGIIKEDNNLELMYEKLNVVIDELEDLEIEEMSFKVDKK